MGSLHLLGASVDLLFTLLSPSAETQDQVQGGFLLDVVVAQCTPVLQLLSGKDETLLIRGDSLLVLDLSLDVVDRIGRFDIQCDGLAWIVS